MGLMKVCSLASGSKGNSAIVIGENSFLMVDIGVNLKHVNECLCKLQINPNDISGVLITHEHSDHIKGVESFCNKYDVPIFCHESLYNVICAQMPKCLRLINSYNSNFELGEFKVFPFELAHDSASCFGYRIYDDGGSVSFVTDTGYLPDSAYKVIENSPLVFLEANYDPDMLFACSYPIFLKKRIMSNNGHLSNLDCAKIIEKLSKTGTRVVALSHLSENSNTPYLAYNTIKNYLENKNVVIDKDIKIGINYQGKLNTIYKLSNKNKNP